MHYLKKQSSGEKTKFKANFQTILGDPAGGKGQQEADPNVWATIYTPQQMP